MAHPYRLREIAQQAGLSVATVDRALHRRPGIRASTIDEVEAAVAELDRQKSQMRLAGRTFLVDLVMQAPERFSSAVRSALEAELPLLRPVVIRSRFHLREAGSPDDVARSLDGIGRRGSQGVILKAPDDPVVDAAVSRLVDRGIPVVTFVTDLPMSRRVAYVGVDNRAAGATAAYLLTQWTGSGAGSVLVTLSSARFRGEEEREMGFRAAMREMAPRRTIREVDDTDGLDATMLEGVGAALRDDPAIDAVYSIGGGNTAVVRAFEAAGRRLEAFVAHDLDGDNTALLRQRRISAVLHHDLRDDVRRICRIVMQAQGALPGSPHSLPSHIQVVTPYNEPSAFHPHR